jgi:hypothetical protein
MTTYTTAAAIAAYLGETFTPEQAAQADDIALAVTAFIDNYTGQTWQGTSPVTAEWLPLIARYDDGTAVTWPTVYLRQRPAVAVTAVVLRSGGPSATPTTLDPSQYELVDPQNGVLRLSPSGAGVDAYGHTVVALVDYTYAAAVPPDITLAATMIGATEMARVLALQEDAALIAAHPELAGLKSIAVGQNDVNVQLAGTTAAAGATDAGSSWVTPGSAVAAILNSYRRMVVA